jgi:hypothetical protein
VLLWQRQWQQVGCSWSPSAAGALRASEGILSEYITQSNQRYIDIIFIENHSFSPQAAIIARCPLGFWRVEDLDV